MNSSDSEVAVDIAKKSGDGMRWGKAVSVVEHFIGFVGRLGTVGSSRARHTIKNNLGHSNTPPTFRLGSDVFCSHLMTLYHSTIQRNEAASDDRQMLKIETLSP